MKKVALGIVLMVVASQVSAAMKPGLWEITSTTNFTSGGPNAAQVEQLKKLGVKIALNEPKASKYCLSREMAARDVPPNVGEKQGCKRTSLKRSGNKISADLVCNGEIKGSGHMDAVVQSATAYTAKLTVAGTSSRFPLPVEIASDATGKWLGADCGEIKPADQK